jgi:hypothetical protein
MGEIDARLEGPNQIKSNILAGLAVQLSLSK